MVDYPAPKSPQWLFRWLAFLAISAGAFWLYAIVKFIAWLIP